MESMSRKRVPKPQVIRHHWPNAPLDLPFLIHPFFPASVMKSLPHQTPTPVEAPFPWLLKYFTCGRLEPAGLGPWAVGFLRRGLRERAGLDGFAVFPIGCQSTGIASVTPLNILRTFVKSSYRGLELQVVIIMSPLN